MSLATRFRITITHTHTKPVDLSIPADALTLDLGDTLADGIGLDEADVVWHDRRSLVATSENIDLIGALFDVFGDAASFIRIKGIVIRNRETVSGRILSVGGAAANTFSDWVGNATDIVKIKPDGVLLLTSPKFGYQVVAGTQDILKIDSGASNITYDIYILGTSSVTTTTSTSTSTSTTSSTSSSTSTTCSSTCSTLSTTSSTCSTLSTTSSTCSTLSTTSSTCSTLSTTSSTTSTP